MSLPKLFQPARIGALSLRNRIVMAPLTRCRATPGDDAPWSLNVEYYQQRASAGLIVSEGTQVSPQGKGYAGTPGIYSDAQVAGWRAVTDAVHAAGGTIVAQLWHVGRISHPSLQPGGALPIAPSAVAARGKSLTESGPQEMVAPRALLAHEIAPIIEEFRHAARCAQRAGFDGAEIHGANGYLLDQFMCDGSNQRSDDWGGTVEKRARFTLEVVDAVAGVLGRERTGIRLSPVSAANDRADSHPQSIFGHVVEQLAARRIAFIHFIEGNTGRERNLAGFDFAAARRAFPGAYIANNGYDRAMAIEAIDSNGADAVAFGKPFISNPDLVRRLELDAPLATWNSKLFYARGPQGYTDYPALEDAAATA